MVKIKIGDDDLGFYAETPSLDGRILYLHFPNDTLQIDLNGVHRIISGHETVIVKFFKHSFTELLRQTGFANPLDFCNVVEAALFELKSVDRLYSTLDGWLKLLDNTYSIRLSVKPVMPRYSQRLYTKFEEMYKFHQEVIASSRLGVCNPPTAFSLLCSKGNYSYGVYNNRWFQSDTEVVRYLLDRDKFSGSGYLHTIIGELKETVREYFGEQGDHTLTIVWDGEGNWKLYYYNLTVISLQDILPILA